MSRNPRSVPTEGEMMIKAVAVASMAGNRKLFLMHHFGSFGAGPLRSYFIWHEDDGDTTSLVEATVPGAVSLLRKEYGRGVQDVRVLDVRKGNPYGPRSRFKHERLQYPSRSKFGRFRTITTPTGARVVVGVRRRGVGPMGGRTEAQAILTPKRNDPHDPTRMKERVSASREYVVHLHHVGTALYRVEAWSRKTGVRVFSRDFNGSGAAVLAFKGWEGPTKNPPAIPGAPVIYGRTESIKMTKTTGPYRGQGFVHKFGPGVRQHGLPPGTRVLIPAGRRGFRAVELTTRTVLLEQPKRHLWQRFT